MHPQHRPSLGHTFMVIVHGIEHFLGWIVVTIAALLAMAIVGAVGGWLVAHCAHAALGWNIAPKLGAEIGAVVVIGHYVLSVLAPSLLTMLGIMVKAVAVVAALSGGLALLSGMAWWPLFLSVGTIFCPVVLLVWAGQFFYGMLRRHRHEPDYDCQS